MSEAAQPERRDLNLDELRKLADSMADEGLLYAGMVRCAADEIAALRAENERLTERCARVQKNNLYLVTRNLARGNEVGRLKAQLSEALAALKDAIIELQYLQGYEFYAPVSQTVIAKGCDVLAQLRGDDE